VPTIRSATAGALVIGALIAVSIVVQAVALATAIDRSILHHSALVTVRPELITVALAVVARAALTLLGEHLARRSAESVVAVLRGQLLRQVLSLGPAWLAGERPGELSLTALVVAVPVTMIYCGREANRRTARQWRRLGSLAGRFLQLIEGLPTLRAFGREGYGRREIIESTEGVRVATMRTLRVAFLSALAMDLIAGFGVGLVAMVLGLRLLWGELSLQTALAVLLVAPEIFIPLRRAGAEFHASTEGQAAATRVLEVLALAADGSADAGGPAESGRAPGRQPRHPVDLRIDGLRVEYDDRAAPALAGFTLHAPPGARIALVGPSGAGKSSVFDALLGFAPRAAGTMTIDGRESAEVPVREWRAYFSRVPQRPYLFTASMAENLRLGAGTATDEALRSVCEVVGLDGLVAHLPRGLETPLGQDGLTLSAGERQRVALARALLCPAPILLLDEPTASLDQPAIIRIASAIEPWLAGRTVIVAAHEPLLLPHFDVVCEVAASPLTAVIP